MGLQAELLELLGASSNRTTKVAMLLQALSGLMMESSGEQDSEEDEPTEVRVRPRIEPLGG